MTVHVGTRTGGKSVGSAVLGVLLTLGIFVLTFVGFLLAPLALLLAAFLVWTVVRPRQGSEPAAPTATESTDGTDSTDSTDGDGTRRGRSSTTDFGSGAR